MNVSAASILLNSQTNSSLVEPGCFGIEELEAEDDDP